MNETQRKKVSEEILQIKEACTRGPAPEGDDAPEWTRDGVESAGEFFDGTAHLWDVRWGATYEFLHTATAKQIPKTHDPVSILDVGCGTGLELEHIFRRAPNARVTGLDQSPRMLSELRGKYADRSDQITLIEASCVDWPEKLTDFDFALSILTLHHFPPETKQAIYANIRSSLKSEGTYIEGDQMVRTEIESECLQLYRSWIARLPDGELGAWNYDIRLSPDTNRRLIVDAGFRNCEKVWDDGDGGWDGHAVLVARA
jgi:tRNA (cmo5U34)-methyltransferase